MTSLTGPAVDNMLEAGPEAGLLNRHASVESCLANCTRHPLRRGCEDESDDGGVSP